MDEDRYIKTLNSTCTGKNHARFNKNESMMSTCRGQKRKSIACDRHWQNQKKLPRRIVFLLKSPGFGIA